MRYGIHLANFGPTASTDTIVALAREAEELGYSSVWVSDHVVIPARFDSEYPYPGTVFTPDTAEAVFEALTTLAFVAGATSRVRLGTSVLVAPQREPLLMAKQLATLDALSAGRLDVGLGAGWLAEEFTALGASFRDRGPVLDEWIAVFRAVWTESEPSFSGSYASFEPLRFVPKPVQPGGPPITIGGHNPRSLRRAAETAGWHAFRLGPSELAEPIAGLRALAEEAGRDPATLEIVLRCSVEVTDAPGKSDGVGWRLVGSPGQVAAGVAAYADAGVTTLIVNPAPGKPVEAMLATMQRLAAEVLPAVEHCLR